MNDIRRIACICALAATAAVCFAPAAACSAPAGTAATASMGTSQGQDLDELMARARREIGLDGRDAVLLFEGRRVSVRANGDLTTRVHRVVWIGTAVGIRDHADLRVPYDSDASKMTVAALRTWRDGRWWPDAVRVSDTAVVETLPFDLAQADDYTGMRETMLLHDGVEIPCIVETAWEIEERGAAGRGADGLWVFPQRDPAVRVEFALSAPAGTELRFKGGNGAPDPVATEGEDGFESYVWTMEKVERLGSPQVADPASYAPYLAWSTWRDWDALGEKIVSSFDDAAISSEELADTIAARLALEPSPRAKAKTVAAFVDESTRSIRYDSRFWTFSPRAASRTWETAYGHALDRAVLAAALFREAGLDAKPVYRSIGVAGVDMDVPSLSRFSPIGLVVSGDGLDAFYDPWEGKLTDGPSPVFGRVVWAPGEEGLPSPGPGFDDAEATSDFSLVITLEPAEDGTWNGTGYLSASGCFSPHADMAGVRGEALAHLGKIAGSVVAGSTVKTYNPEVFTRDEVAVGFAIEVKAPEKDDQGRVGIAIGAPAGGIASRLPSDVHLYHEKRSSPVAIAGGMTQTITLRLKTGEREIVYLPEPRGIENETGSYNLAVDRRNGSVTIERRLSLRHGLVGPGAWPDLRALLLEDSDAGARTLIMK